MQISSSPRTARLRRRITYRLWSGLATSTILGLPAAAAAQTAPPACADAAQSAFNEGQYQGAVLLAEKCWQATLHPRALYLAAMAHLALKHDSQAILALRRYLAGALAGESARSVDVARIRLEQLQARTTPVTLQISPPVARGVQLELGVTREADADPATEFTVDVSTLETGPSGFTLRLEPGAWRLKLSRVGYTPVERAVEVPSSSGEAVVEFAMVLEEPAPQSPLPPQSEPAVPAPVQTRSEVNPALARGLKIGLTAGGAGVAAGGVVLAIVGAVRRKATVSCDPADVYSCAAELTGAMRLRSTGASLIGGGLGVMAGGLTWLARDPGTRRKAWFAELGLGGAIVVGGAIGLTLGSLQLNRASAAPFTSWSEFYDRPGQIGHTISAGLFGLGVGLIASAGTGMIVQRAARGRWGAASTLRVSPAFGPGVVVSGRF